MESEGRVVRISVGDVMLREEKGGGDEKRMRWCGVVGGLT